MRSKAGIDESCLKDFISETLPPPRRWFDVLREKIDL